MTEEELMSHEERRTATETGAAGPWPVADPGGRTYSRFVGAFGPARVWRRRLAEHWGHRCGNGVGYIGRCNLGSLHFRGRFQP